jgi:hypothetical protein
MLTQEVRASSDQTFRFINSSAIGTLEMHSYSIILAIAHILASGVLVFVPFLYFWSKIPLFFCSP